MRARIFRPAKTAMQSGRAKISNWRLEFEAAASRQIDPLMGWTSSSDTKQQVALSFDSKEAAVSYCKKHEIEFVLRDPQERRIRPKAYADNFRYDRVR